ncbi:TetR/AcrR family transcriptional regulator [Amycolatopsis cynarae]|uniref:TetR/AcrR family transcriptional regulator n=1 Tax=Amycolatopsis cynarae TaxID=2995223 RepID=A0ABY7BA62_9PSEU|nr:TetR/AcrR family transcriptional regulator [Amycolatopsis sp. HUAS 11-8]WAL69255.1 TetR/AcrR family transcriptional regulator [Amycolatopsis sp. HUAS 11-8]
MTETRSRRRGAELEQAILDAAWAELRETGYNALTIEAVAARAGTSKSVLYRRWASRAELVLAAWSRQMPVQQGVPDTGELRGDLIALFGRIARRVDTMMSEMIAGVMGETFRHPEILAVLQEQMKNSPVRKAMDTIVARAAARGELPPLRLTPRIALLPLDLVRQEAFQCRSPVSREIAAELVDEVYLPLLRGLSLDRSGAA